MHAIQHQVDTTKPDQMGPNRPREQMGPPRPESQNMNLEQLQEALLAQRQQAVMADVQYQEALNRQEQHEYNNQSARGLGRPLRGLINHFTKDSREERRNSALEDAVNATTGVSRLEQEIAQIHARQQEQAANAERFETEGLYQQYGTSRPEAALRARGLDIPSKPTQAKPAYKDLGQTTSGQFGTLAGNIVTTAVPGGLAIKGASLIPGVVRTARAIPLLSKAPQVVKAAAHGGVMGATGAATLPATGEDFWAEKAAQIRAGGGIGAITGGALKGTGQIVENLLPQNLGARALNALGRRKANTDFARAGNELVEKTGIELSPAAQSGSKALTFAENAARQSVFSSDQAFRYDQKVANQVVKYINKTLDDISPKGAGTEAVGEHIRSTVKGAVKKITDQRDKIAAKEYGAIRQLVKGKPILQPNNLQQELKGILEEFDGVQAADAKKVATWAKTTLKNIDDYQDVGKAIQNRRFWSGASKGFGNLFKDASPGLQRKIAGRVVRAIERDLDETAEALGGEVGDMLRNANANYRKAMQSIEYIENSPLGRLMGQEFVDALNTGNAFNKIAPEKLVQQITRLHPSEIGVVKKILVDQSPETWQAIKRRLIEDALEEAMQAAPAAGANTLAIQGNKFINGLVKKNVDVKRLKAIYSPKELSELNDGFEAIRRWGDRTGYNFSGTGAMNQFLGWLRSFGVKTMATAGGEVMALRQVAKAMNDPTARRHIIQMTRLPNLEVPRKSVAYLSAIFSAKEVDEEYGSRANGY